MPTKFSSSEIDIINNSLKQELEQQKQMEATATKQTADRVGDIFKKFPMLPADVVLPAAKAGWTDIQLDQLAKKVLVQLGQDPDSLEPESVKPQKKGFDLFGKLKTASRWTTAALNFPSEMVQGGIAQFFDDQPGVKGWYASTELGTMSMESEKAGSGWFVSGEAKVNQGRRARQYRGTAGGEHAFTLGRGLASVFTPNGSTSFNMLSGFVDAVVALAVPSVPGGKAVKAGAKSIIESEDASRGAKAAAEIVMRASRAGATIQPSKITGEEYSKLAKAAAEELGLVGDTIDVGKFNGFLGTEKGKRLVQNLVEANTLDDVYKATNKNIYLSTAKALRDAKTDQEVLGVLFDSVGKEAGLSRTRIPGAGVTYASRKHMMDFLNELPLLGSAKTKRLVSNVPRSVADMDAIDPLEQRATIQTIDNWMRQSLFDDETRRQTLDRAADVLVGEGATASAKKQFIEDFEELMLESWVRNGVAPEVAEALMAKHRVIAGRTQLYNLDAAGEFTDSGFYKGLAGDVDKIENGILVGPQNAAELARNVLEMPDPRQIRRLTSDIGWIVGKSQAGALKKAARFEDPNLAALSQAGKLRLPFAIVDGVQQVWRTTTLATVAYSVRNLFEGQMRLAFNNGQSTSIFRHPLQHLMWATKTKGAGDVLGYTWDGLDIGEAAVRTQREYEKALDKARAAYRTDPIADYRIAERTGDWQRVEKGVNDRVQVVQGHGDQIGKLNAELVDRLIAAGATDDEIKLLVGFGGQAAPPELIAKWERTIGTDDPAEWMRDMRDIHNSGRPVFIPGTNGKPGRWADEPVSINLDLPENMNLYLRESRERVMRFTGGRSDLQDVVASGLLPAERVVGAEVGLTARDAGQVRTIPGPSGRGTRSVRVIEFDENTGEAVVRPFAFREGESSNDLRRLLNSDDVYYDKNLPTVFGWESRQPNYLKPGNPVKEQWDSVVDSWFGFVYGKPSAYLERGPAFRQQYFNWVDQLVPSLKQEALDSMVNNIRARAKSLNIAPEQYVGNAKRWKRILDFQEGRKTPYGTLSLKEMDAYAKGNALDDLKTMLYDASERNNLTDVARIVMPFAQAQVDFYKALGRMAFVDTGFGKMPNIYNLRRAQLIVDGGISADPDGDGRGFFYRDPQSGQWSFSYPLGGKLTNMLTKFLPGVGGGPGITAEMQAPVSGVLLGFDMRPGLGPIGQFAASRILPDAPQYDAIRNWLLPFGETAFKGEGVGQQAYKSFVPSWLQKVVSGLNDSPEGSSIYANTFMETYRALATSGKYDLSTNQGQEDLYNQTKKYARTLTIMRGFIQFSGPSRFSPEFEVATKQGDMLATLLTKEFFDMQNDKENGGYDTAVQRFIEIFGENAAIYTARKSTSNVGGLESTEEASKFERENKSLFRSYKDVAGFFAPGGGAYSQAAYFRQLQTGQKERVTPEELLSQYQRTIGFSYYKAMRDKAGPYPTDEQRAYLRQYREFLIKKYPGFGEGETKTTQERSDELGKLREAASTIPDNAVAQAVEKYMVKRDAALEELAKVGLSSLSGKQAEPFRDYLYGYGEALAQTHPDFARVWQQLISYEVDLG